MADGLVPLYDVHSDHLDTPKMLTDAADVPVWRAAHEAFGKASVSTDPDGSVVTPDPQIPFNIRFPGQYYDAESGLHQNRHRYYSPELGRYISADPIAGLSPGENPYTYGYSNPLVWIDSTGLKPAYCSCPSAGGETFEEAAACCSDEPPMHGSQNPNPYPPSAAYMGISARRMYRDGGNMPWSQLTRGCLACLHARGADFSQSHAFCYANATSRVGFLGSVFPFLGAVGTAVNTVPAQAFGGGVTGVGNATP